MAKKITNLIFILFLISTLTFSQESRKITIEGNVESELNIPISNAIVKIFNSNNIEVLDSTITDNAGYYKLVLSEITGIEEENAIPTSFSLAQNYPNPFSQKTNIDFTTKKEGNVKLEVFNVIGQKVATLFNNYLSPHSITVGWNGRNFNGEKIANGIYIYRLSLNNEVISKKMLLINGISRTPSAGSASLINNGIINPKVAQIYSENNYIIKIMHPSIVSIEDTITTNSDKTEYTFNYSATDNASPVPFLAFENSDSRNFKFNAQYSKDDHDGLNELQFQFDVNEDGISDIPGGENSWQKSPVAPYTFQNDTPWKIGVRVKDSDGSVSEWLYNVINEGFAIYPSDVFPFYDQWKITLGTGSEKKDLINYENNNYFYNTITDTDWVVYKTPNSGGTTANSSNTRSELRQYSEWKPATGGNLTGTVKVMNVSTSGDARVPATFSVIVGQIHSSEGHENEPLKIFYKKFPGHKKGSVFWNYEINTEGSNSERWDYSTAVWGYDWAVVGDSPNTYPEEPDDGIELGEEFSYIVNVYDGIMYLTFTSEGHETVTFTKSLVESEYTTHESIPQQVLTVFSSTGQDGTEQANAYADELLYFKQGAYNQTNGKDPNSNMIWNTGSETYGGNLELQYANGSYAEVWFKKATVGEGVTP